MENEEYQDEVSCTHLADSSLNSSNTLELTDGQIYCTELENDRIKPQISNMKILNLPKKVTLSQTTKLNINPSSHQSSGSGLDPKPVKSLVTITKVPSLTDKEGVSSTIQSTTTNKLINFQPKTSNTFDIVTFETGNEIQLSTTKAIRRHSSSEEHYSTPKKCMKITPGSTQNLHNLSQDKLSNIGIVCSNKTRVANRDSNSSYTALGSENKKTIHEKISSEPKEDEKTHCKTAVGRNSKTQNLHKKKSPNFPVPANINQYGDCLKTKVGIQSYGMTLFDPPCQFFRGVLKGSSGQTLAVMFGDTDLFSKLEQIPKDIIGHFAIDTTYKVIPDSTFGANNVMAILLLFQNRVVPVWYAVTSCSSPELYKRIILEFQQYVLDWPFTSILLNSDPDLIKAVNAIFPNIEMYGSWYHYCISIWNEMRAQNLVEECKSNAMLMRAFKMLMAVPFLPAPTDEISPNTMLEGFQAVVELAHEQCLPNNFQNVLNYIDSFWFKKVKCKNFTLFQKKIHIIKYIEMFQIGLLSFVKPDGNIWTLTNQFRNFSKETYIDVMRYLSGKPFMSKKCPRRKHMSLPSHTNFFRLMRKKYGVETFLDNSASYCDEFFDIVLHPMYPTGTMENNSVYIEGWRIK